MDNTIENFIAEGWKEWPVGFESGFYWVCEIFYLHSEKKVATLPKPVWYFSTISGSLIYDGDKIVSDSKFMWWPERIMPPSLDKFE